MAADEEFVRERVDGFGADAVQADAELEDLVVIFGAGVYFRDTIDHFAERDAAAEIAHRHAVVLDVNLDFLAVAHDVFVNRIIDDLFEQDVTAIVLVRSIANPPDIHTRAQPDMLQGGQCLNFALVVNVFRRIRHKLWALNIRVRRATCKPKTEFCGKSLAAAEEVMENTKINFRTKEHQTTQNNTKIPRFVK